MQLQVCCFFLFCFCRVSRRNRTFLGALVALYEEGEKPNNATEFVRRYMGATGPDSAEIEAIKNELMLMREKNDELLRENEILKEKLHKYEGGQ